MMFAMRKKSPVGSQRTSQPRRNAFRTGVNAAAVFILLLQFGCAAGGGSSKSGSPQQPLAISTQPQSEFAPIGRPATFSVTATGEAPLKYQWRRNGQSIAGATGASYTLPTVSLGDSGTTFQVEVSDASGTLNSTLATLTAGPRAPAVGDLRYLLWQQVTLPGLTQSPGQAGVASAGWEKVPDSVGTTLQLGPGLCSQYSACAWAFSVLMLPPPMTGLTMFYKAGNLSQFSSDLQSIIASNVVITSLDLKPAYNQYGISWVQASQFTGFDYRLQRVPLADVQATAAADGANGRIVTAVSFDAENNANLISYGWQGDPTTAYDVKTMTIPAANVAASAAQLAGTGYFISAFGGSDANGWILVGERVMGDTLPRPISVDTAFTNTLPSHPDSAYLTPVVRFNSPASGYLIVAEQ